MSGRWRLAAVLAGLWALACAGLVLAGWPSYWRYIASEQTPMTWLQSVVLVVAGCASALVATLAVRLGSQAAGRPWWLLAVGFGGLALDERFALHERVRDGYLAPRGVVVPFLPWVAPGDFVVMAIALAGLAVLPLVWRGVMDDVWARRALALGVTLAVVSVGLDSVDPSTWSVAQERLQQSVEEMIELGSGMALLAAVLLRLMSVVARLVPASTPVPEASRADVRE